MPTTKICEHAGGIRRGQALVLAFLLMIAFGSMAAGQQDSSTEPPRVRAARQFLARRGWTPAAGIVPRALPLHTTVRSMLQIQPMSSGGPIWAALGPTAVLSPNFGLLTGRVTALALDPADATGNKLYIGTTGGGVWVTQNAATFNAASVAFSPLTDSVAALSGAQDASISIGALSVQPGGTGVILAGTGDVNDMLDSYYGAGILRSIDGGNTWSLIDSSNDEASGLGVKNYTFAGEGFAGFAWSTRNTQVVVAAVSEAYGGAAVLAQLAGKSYRGLYYSTDAGASWHLATIQDGTNIIQGPLVVMAQPNGNAATSVVWNPVRQIFEAAIRYHGYYQSSDGVTWTRMTSQPGTNLTTSKCPTNRGSTGSTGCSIYRGTLAVNPNTGDTFAWTVDASNVDQGLWQDACSALANGGNCASQTISFSKQWSTAALQSSVAGSATGILNGTYTLALAAVPDNQDTLLLAGANDLWRCSLANGCVWRNTTNTSTCHSAGVAPYQHVLAWSRANPQEIFVGNDSGLWRSMDAIAQTGAVCAASDANHFQNLNSSLGSLADVESIAPVYTTPYTLMAGLGVNGAAGVKAATTTANWPQILGGFGGPVTIDSSSTPVWYVNNQPGVAIYSCAQTAACTPADFGTSPVIQSSQVGDDGSTMDTPAPFLVDPLDAGQLLIGTCRVWRGPATGSGWSSSNALSNVLDGGSTTGKCYGDGLIGVMAAMPLTAGGEVIYAGMRGSAEGGGLLAGHVLKAQFTPPATGTTAWTDVTSGAVSNDALALNAYGLSISSIFLDPHDGTGKTVYVTVAGVQTLTGKVQTVYRSIDGGVNWTSLTANLPPAVVNAVLVDPQNAGIVYVATDVGVYFTNSLASCTLSPYSCWTLYGSGLPMAPVVALESTPAGVADGVLVAATYGRGIWTASLATTGSALTTATALPSPLDFGSQAVGTVSTAQTVTLTNTGAQVLTPTGITVPGAWATQDNCVGKAFAAGASCAIQVFFVPSTTGPQSGALTITANVAGGNLTVQLTGTGLPAGVVAMNPVRLDFGSIVIGSTSAAQSTTVNNTGGAAVSITSASADAPFAVTSDLCSGTSLAASSACQIKIAFAPVAAGAFTGILTVTDAMGTQTVLLTGTGVEQATDTLSTSALVFPATAVGTLSAAQTVSLTNGGGLLLTGISISTSSTPGGQFQQSNTCGGQLLAQNSCTIAVVFSPTQTGALSDTLSISDAQRTQTVLLNGQAVETPAFSVTPTSLTFSNQAVGVASAAQTVTITNAGALPMANIGLQLTGAAAASYSLVANTCGATLAAGASCTVGVVFTPSGTGAISALLSISSSTAHVAAVGIPINGYAQVTGGLTANPSAVNFGTVAIGQAPAAQTVTIGNGTGYAIAAPALSITAPFTVSSSTCTGTLAAGATCTAVVGFPVSAAGVYSGALLASSATVAQTLSITLSASVFDFGVTISGSSSISIAAGQVATYTMTIAAASGLQGSFAYTYSCGTLPARALCTFNPTALTAPAGVTGYVGISISTGKASAARGNGPTLGRDWPVQFALLLVSLVLFHRRRMLALWMVLLVVLAVTGCASAGISSSGGSGGSGSGTTTPAGTYSIPVSVTSNGVTHTVQLTLTVL